MRKFRVISSLIHRGLQRLSSPSTLKYFQIDSRVPTFRPLVKFNSKRRPLIRIRVYQDRDRRLTLPSTAPMRSLGDMVKLQLIRRSLYRFRMLFLYPRGRFLILFQPRTPNYNYYI